MVDHVHFLEESPQLGPVADVSASEMHIRSESLWVARGKIVQTPDLMSLTGKMVGKRRAEESRGSSDQEVHISEIISETT
jgi:hypothetical protein